jgi:cytochrome o ubiquinol oxidase subunit 2
MVSQLHLQADSPAETWGISAQFSGDGFSDMQFPVKSLPAAEFAAWVDSVKGAGPMLDRTAYAGLLQQSQDVPPSTFGSIDPGLFQAVATQEIPPGPGPEPNGPEHAGREVSTGGKD